MRLIVCLFVSLLLTGCGIKTQVVRVDVPDVHVNPERGPVVIVGAVADNRPSSFLSQFPAADRSKNVGGVVRGGNGINVVLESSMTTEKVRAILVQALRSMGYRTASQCEVSCTQLDVSLTDFSVKMPFNFWRAAGWSQQMVADVSAHVVAKDTSHTRAFDVSGHGTNIYQVVSRENWETALDRAVKDFSSNFKQAMAAQGSGVTTEGSQHGSP
jgi:hypothetical protein